MAQITSISNVSEHIKTVKKVVLVHGVFDLFHAGHLAILMEAGKLGSHVIVGVDSDELTEKIKRRPVFSFSHRLQIVSHIDCVAYVLPLRETENDPDSLFWKVYSFLRPDIVAFGTHCPFEDNIKRKCSLLGLEAKKVSHAFNDIHTSFYVERIRAGG